MTDAERRAAAKQFAANWAGRGDEKQETHAFWMALLQKVFGVEEPDKFIAFEVPVKLSHTSFIDGYISSTRVLIEQKGHGIDLRKKATSSPTVLCYLRSSRHGAMQAICPMTKIRAGSSFATSKSSTFTI